MPIDLHAPELTTQELLACVPGLSADLLTQWLYRKHIVPLRAGEGRGKRRLYTPHDAVQVATIFELQRQGIIVSKAPMVWFLVRSRLTSLRVPQLFGGDTAYLLTIHPETGDLVMRSFGEDDPNPEADGLERDDAPDVCVLFRVDRFIRRVLARVEAVLSDAPLPAQPDPTHGQEDPETFFRVWDTDEAGRKVRTGLTFLETAEFTALDENRAALTDIEEDRREALFNQHEDARRRRINAEIVARDQHPASGGDGA